MVKLVLLQKSKQQLKKNTMKVTYEKLIKFNNTSQAWLKKQPTNKNSKLGYAIEKMTKRVSKLLKPVIELEEEKNIKINDIRADNALTGDKKQFLYDTLKGEKGEDIQVYQYTPELRKKRDAEIRVVLKKFEEDFEKIILEEVELENPYYATEAPVDLEFSEVEAFAGIVINPSDTICKECAPTVDNV